MFGEVLWPLRKLLRKDSVGMWGMVGISGFRRIIGFLILLHTKLSILKVCFHWTLRFVILLMWRRGAGIQTVAKPHAPKFLIFL